MKGIYILKTLILTVLVMIAVGCSNKAVNSKVIKTEKPIAVKAHNRVAPLAEIIPNVPPDKDKFMEANSTGKIHMLSLYVRDLLNTIKFINKEIREHNEQLKEYEK